MENIRPQHMALMFILNKGEPIIVYEKTLLNDVEVLDIALTITNVFGQNESRLYVLRDRIKKYS